MLKKNVQVNGLIISYYNRPGKNSNVFINITETQEYELTGSKNRKYWV